MAKTPAVDVPYRDAVEGFLLKFQDRAPHALEQIGGAARFREERIAGDRGLAQPRVLSDGPVIERAAVNFSHTIGRGMPAAATSRRPELEGASYDAVSVSLIVHPRNPYAPTS